MPKAELYWYASCSQSRSARRELIAKGYELDEREYFRKKFTEPEFRALLKRLKLKPRDVFSSKSPSVKAFQLDPEKMTDDEMVKWMLKEPRLIRRPIIVINGKPIIGYDQAQIDAL